MATILSIQIAWTTKCMYYTHVFFNNDILSKNVTILHVVCVSEMLNFQEYVNMKHERLSGNQLHMTFDTRLFETALYFKNKVYET